MFEGLLERRSEQKEIEESQQRPVDTSDDEPVAKVAKFANEQSFTSCKSRELGEQSGTEFDADADSEGSENEMDFLAVADMTGSDCVDGALIIPVTHSTPPKTPSPNATFETPKGTVIRRMRPKDFSKFHRSNRKSKNCAIFYFKHDDTDNDQANGNDSEAAEKPLDSSEASEEEVWEYSNTSNDVSPLTPDKNENIGDGLDRQSPLVQALITTKDDEAAEATHKQDSQQRHKVNGNVSTPALVSLKLTLLFVISFHSRDRA